MRAGFLSSSTVLGRQTELGKKETAVKCVALNPTKIMTNTGQGQEEGQEKEKVRCRAIIISACKMLVDSQRSMTALGRELPYSTADCYILLQDATRLYCQYVSEHYAESRSNRWSPALPEVLLSHPERCEETLDLVERKDFQGVSYLHFVAA